MEDVRDGRVEKLAVLFERHQVVLYNFFLRLTGNRSASEDLVQDVFMRILKYRAGYQGRDRFAVWMFRIARNAHIDHLRSAGTSSPEKPARAASQSPAEDARGGRAALMHRAWAPAGRNEVLMFRHMRTKLGRSRALGSKSGPSRPRSIGRSRTSAASPGTPDGRTI
jgi:RNA polymerase sigma-70 factor (ECF subfamily)